MRRHILIPAALAVVVLAAALTALGVRTGPAADDGVRSLPELSVSSEEGEGGHLPESVKPGETGEDGDPVETGVPGTDEAEPTKTGKDGTPETDGTGPAGSSETGGAGTDAPSHRQDSGADNAVSADKSGSAGTETTGGRTGTQSSGIGGGNRPSNTGDGTGNRLSNTGSGNAPSSTEEPDGTGNHSPSRETAEDAPSTIGGTGGPANAGGTGGPANAGGTGGPAGTGGQGGTGDTGTPGSTGRTGGAAPAEEPAKDSGPMEITMERPPFDGHYLCPALSSTAETAVPVALVLRSATENGGASAKDWMEAHWEEWMDDPRFASEQNQDLRTLIDQDRRYSYYLDDNGFPGQSVTIVDNRTQETVLYVDLFSYLFPDTAAAAASDGTDAQSVRWARLLGGRLFVSNSSDVGGTRTGDRDAYLTAIDPRTGLLLWRTDPQVCGTANFAVPGPADGSGGVLLCGGVSGTGSNSGTDGSSDTGNNSGTSSSSGTDNNSGTGSTGGFLYQVGMKTGEILDRTPIDSAPEWIVCTNGAAYVHCADWDYVFNINFS